MTQLCWLEQTDWQSRAPACFLSSPTPSEAPLGSPSPMEVVLHEYTNKEIIALLNATIIISISLKTDLVNKLWGKP